MDTFVNRYGFVTDANAPPSRNTIRTENARLEKWTTMLENWDDYLLKSQLKKRVRKGIPNSIRGSVWYKLANAEEFRERFQKNLYNILLSSNTEVPSMNIITADLSRTFPANIMFKTEEGMQRLERILKAYSLFDSEVGYMQGMSYIAAMFLLFLPEEQAFWMFCTVMKDYNMRECFLRGMPRVQESFYISNGLLRHNFADLFWHFKSIDLSPSMYAVQWFMTGFATCFPIDTVLRIWDCFVFKDKKIVFRVYLSVMKHNYKTLKKAAFDEAAVSLHHISNIPANKLMKDAFKFRILSKTVERLRKDYQNQPKAKYVNWEFQV